MKSRTKIDDFGFTLLELLVVMTIISVLTATALPQYQEYQKRAFDVRSRQDLLSIALAEEAYFLDNEIYLSCINQECLSLPGVARLSDGTHIEVSLSGEDQSGYLIEAYNDRGTGKHFYFNSQLGGLQNR